MPIKNRCLGLRKCSVNVWKLNKLLFRAMKTLAKWLPKLFELFLNKRFFISQIWLAIWKNLSGELQLVRIRTNVFICCDKKIIDEIVKIIKLNESVET